VLCPQPCRAASANSRGTVLLGSIVLRLQSKIAAIDADERASMGEDCQCISE
jgi:hypothetical protein